MFRAFLIALLLTCSAMGLPPDTNATFEELCFENGFDVEEHHVITTDGYILALFHIPGKRNAYPSPYKGTVLLSHGLLGSMNLWAVHWPQLAPAFVLARAGYDVWLMNNRGNEFSRLNLHIEAETDEFWFFDFQEHGSSDLVACMDYILMKTQKDKLSIIAHSQGTTQTFYAMAEDPEYFKKRVNLFVALSPMVHMQHIRSALLVLFAYSPSLQEILMQMHENEMFPAHYMNNSKFLQVCEVINEICHAGAYILTEDDPYLNDFQRYLVFQSHFPSGTSLRSFIHLGQLIYSGQFRKYDYGIIANQKIYGQPFPPEIDIKKLPEDIPVGLIVGTKDKLGTVQDSEKIRDKLGERIVYYGEYELGYSSFFIGKDMAYFRDVLLLLEEHGGNQQTKFVES